jgi:hypothetical protein
MAKPSSAGKVLRTMATKEGNRDLKRALMQAAASISRMEPQKHELVAYYRALTARGLPPLAAQRSVARKLLCTMYSQWKKVMETQSKRKLAA